MAKFRSPQARYYGAAFGALLLVGYGARLAIQRNLASGREMLIASTEGSPAAIHALCLGGAPLEVRDPWTRSTPLILASSVGNEDAAGIVDALLEHGADINARNGNGSTALIEAAEHSHPDVIRVLLAHGADINAVSARGHSALFLAERKHEKEITDMLKAAGAKDINPATAAWIKKGTPN
jgi:ankyrin repeat protein